MDRSREDSRFQTTLRAGGADAAPKPAALSELCRLDWQPLLVFALGHVYQPSPRGKFFRKNAWQTAQDR